MSFSYPYTYTSIDYLGATSAYGINDTGQIVGTTGNPSVGFLDNFGTFTSINYPGG